jgi:hypothetical protein
MVVRALACQYATAAASKGVGQTMVLMISAPPKISGELRHCSKDSSRHLQTNYAISYLFYLHLMLHTYVERFNVMGGRENILDWDEK